MNIHRLAKVHNSSDICKFVSKNFNFLLIIQLNVLSNSKCNFACKVSKNILKNKIKECQNAIFLLVSCLICIVFY